MKKIGFSLILPSFNEGSTLKDSVEKIVKVLKKTGLGWEIIFVEDKSTDLTRETLIEISKKIENSRIILHKNNEGRGKSVSDGIYAAKGDVCGFMDIDCEISPTYIPIFISEIKNGYDMAVGNRFYESGLKSASRLVASKVYSKIVKLFLMVPIKDTEAGFKFFNREKIMPILNSTRDKRWFWDTEICARAYWGGLKISEVPVLFKRRVDKKSTVRLIPDSVEYLKKVIEFKSREGGKRH